MSLFVKNVFLVYEIPVFFMLFGVGLVLTGSTAQAMDLGRGCAGTASAVIGGIGYIAGGLVSPLVGCGDILTVSFTFCCVFLIIGNVIIIRQK